MSILGLCNRENRPKYLHKGFQYGVLEHYSPKVRYRGFVDVLFYIGNELQWQKFLTAKEDKFLTEYF